MVSSRPHVDAPAWCSRKRVSACIALACDCATSLSTEHISNIKQPCPDCFFCSMCPHTWTYANQMYTNHDACASLSLCISVNHTNVCKFYHVRITHLMPVPPEQMARVSARYGERTFASGMGTCKDIVCVCVCMSIIKCLSVHCKCTFASVVS